MCNIYSQTKSQDAMRHLFDDMNEDEEVLEDEIGIEKFASRIVLRHPYERRVEPVEVIASGKSSWK